jgi:hypothetical protein
VNIEIKTTLIRFARVFVASFVVGASVILSQANQEMFINWESFWKSLIVPACLAGATAGISAIGKLIREFFGDKEWVNKLPF